MTGFVLRQATHADSDQLSVLSTVTADGGRVAFSPRYRVAAFDAMQHRHPGSIGVVAEDKATGQLIATAWMSVGTCRVGGRVKAAALLHSLGVHPGWRRRGVAKAMTQWRLERLDGIDETVVMAGIQAGNAASAANAGSWATQVLGPVTVAPVPTSDSPVRRMRGLTVRAARGDDAADIAAGLLAANADVDLGPAYTAESVAAWLGSCYAGAPMTRYLLAVDDAGRAVAGIGAEDQARLMTLHVDQMPRALEVLNRLVQVVPPDRQMRNLQVRMAWHSPGRVDVATALWQATRSIWHERGTALVTMIDPHSPLRRMLRRPAWLPTTRLDVAVRSPVHIDPGRILDPVL
jgi:GNAT superfamily N-acetyltransferase